MRFRTIASRLIVSAMVIAFLVSCTSPPKPAPPVNKEADRAKAIVQGTSTPDFPASKPPQQQGQPSPQSPQTTAQGIVTQSGGFTQSPPPAPAPQPVSNDQPAPVPGSALTPEESAFLTAYLSRLSYMVFYNDQGGMDPRLAKLAISQANRYLIEKMGLSVIDFDQIERNKKDQLDVYQSETGGSIDMIQYIAQKFNADVYVEIDLKSGAEGRPGSYTATAQGTMKIFETSTAALLGSIAFMSPPTYSPATPDAAIANAVAAAVWQAMPKLTEQSKALIGASLSRGVRYELILQKTPDSRQVTQFERQLAKKFREVERLSFSPGETRFAIFTFQARGKVEAGIEDAAEAMNLSDLYLVYMRGKSFTFNTGQ